jgi:hypothetical protein
MLTSLCCAFWVRWHGFAVWLKAVFANAAAADWVAAGRFITLSSRCLVVHACQTGCKPAAKLALRAKPVTEPFEAARAG